jgi:hypothetical protein
MSSAASDAATGEGAEEDGRACMREGVAQRELEVGCLGAFLAVAREQEQAPVDREPDREPGDEVECVDRERGDRGELAQQEEADEDGDAARERRQQARHEAAEKEEGEQDDQRHGQQLGPAQIVLDRRRDLVVGDRVAAQGDRVVAGEGSEQALAGLLLLLVVERSQRCDQVGRAVIAADHGRVVRRPRVEHRHDRRVATQPRLDGGDPPLRAASRHRRVESYERKDAVCGVGAGCPRDDFARLHAAGAGDVEAARLQVVAYVDSEWRRDRGDRQRDREQPPRAAIDQVSESIEHGSPFSG